MCGRYAGFLPPELIARIFGTTNPLPNLAPTWNMAPTRDAPVVRRHPETGERHLADQRPVGNGGPLRDVQGGFRQAPLPGAGSRLLRMAARSNGKTPFAIARKDGEPVA